MVSGYSLLIMNLIAQRKDRSKLLVMSGILEILAGALTLLLLFIAIGGQLSMAEQLGNLVGWMLVLIQCWRSVW